MRWNRSIRGLGLSTLAGCVFAAAALVGCSPFKFEQTFRDDFVGSTLDARWFSYLGHPSTDPNATWTADRVRVEDGNLVLDAVPVPSNPGHWEVGGLANGADPQTYGRWTIRYRASRSSIASYHLLLWPQDESWPPEIDIAEAWDLERQQIEGFVHWKDSTGTRQRERVVTSGDLTQWSTVVLTWTPNLITWTLDGVEWGRVTGEAVPTVPMRLSMQLETQSCDRTTSPCASDSTGTNPRLEVDYVTVERHIP